MIFENEKNMIKKFKILYLKIISYKIIKIIKIIKENLILLLMKNYHK